MLNSWYTSFINSYFQPHNVLFDKDLRPVLMDFGSCSPARVSIRNMREAQYLQDTAAERCSMCYRPPELFQVNSNCDIDERTDIWVGAVLRYLSSSSMIAAAYFSNRPEVTVTGR